MERLTEIINGIAMIKGCGSNCKYGFEHCKKEDWEKCKTVDDVIEKLAEYEDFEEIFREKMTDAACEFLKDKEEFGKWLDRNKWIAKKCDEYARAEEQGLLLRLPCKVGTSVYMVAQDCGGDTLNCMRGNCEGCPYLYSFVEENKFEAYMCDDIGKTVFLTQAKAEQKLKEMEE